ncbi:hypothetical protein EDC96DRAFT_522557 [Choanephora cucurbitarum]|nr:hypothetical protein EDC96DRAFT_522557 [Choanephora cucurbitarum]
MSSFWWGPTAFDELVEKATSELLPAGQVDLALHLEISDQIRSKQVNAKEAMRSLKRRLSHTNPNVILATLSLVDTCVKNSGNAFVKEIATREFMEEMTHLLKTPTGCNQDVKAKILELVQVWGIASKGNNELSYLSGTYSLLKAEGYTFPSVTEKIDAILLEAAAPPDWTDSDCCERCRTTFTLTTRKHHCRHCGGTFCQQCSSKSLPLSHIGINDSVRVCDGCYIKVKLSKVADKEAVPHLLKTPASVSSSLAPTYTPSVKSKQVNDPIIITQDESNAEDTFEDDIKKAIELSLKENQVVQKAEPVVQRKTAEEEEKEEEAALAAAIAASLQDMEAQIPRRNPNELSEADMENIRLFSTLMQHVYSSGNGISGHDEVSTLYTQIGALQPKLIKSLDEASRKHALFVEMHSKLIAAIKTYDNLLETKLSASRHPSYNMAPYSAQNNYQPQTLPARQSYVSYPALPNRTSSEVQLGVASSETHVPYYQPAATLSAPAVSHYQPLPSTPSHQLQPQPPQQLHQPYQPHPMQGGYPVDNQYPSNQQTTYHKQQAEEALLIDL